MFIRFIAKIVPLLFVFHVHAMELDSSLIYYQFGLEAAKSNKPVICEKYLNKAIASAKDDSLKASAYIALGINSKIQGKYQYAMEAYNHALSFTKDLELLSKIYSNQGIITKINGNYQKALLLYNKALEATNDQKQISLIYNNIANIYYQQNKCNEALSCFLKCYNINKRLDPQNLTYTYLNIALCYQKLRNKKEAEKYFIKTIQERVKLLGEKHYRLILAYLYYGDFLINTNPQKSFELLSKANNLVLLNYGKKHPETARTFI